MKTTITIILVSSLFVSCSSYKKIKLTDCQHSSGYCKEIRDEAFKSWKYAMLSNNVYGKKMYNVSQLFTFLEKHEDTILNYYSELYKDNNTGEYVLVFRGTDSITDFQTGNNPINQEQNKHALNIYDDVKNRYSIDSIIATGHSLGGGISTNLSLNREKIKTYIFNASPVFNRNGNRIDNDRHSIAENGEILKITRLFGREADQIYTSINCSKGNPVKQHGILPLTNCLIKIASNNDESIRNYLIE